MRFSCSVVIITALLLIASPILFPSGSRAAAIPSGISGQAFEATAVWGSTKSPLVAAPSSSNLPLFITLYDLGPAAAIYGVSVSFAPSTPLSAISGEPKVITQYVPELTAGQSRPTETSIHLGRESGQTHDWLVVRR